MKDTSASPSVPSPSGDLAGSRRLALALLALSVAGLVVHATRYLGLIVDDSYIYYRFAENFARGDGLVFNAGERVEGHSSTLWTLLLGTYAKRGIDLPGAARWTGIVLSAGSLVLSWKLARGLGAGPVLATLAPALLATSAPFAMWSASGMPMPLFVFLLLTTAVVYQRELSEPNLWPLSALVMGLLAISRPEAFLVPLVFFGHSILHLLAHERPTAYYRQTWIRILTALILIGAFLAWRLGYYGHLFSNATYAKLGGDGGPFSAYSLEQYVRGLQHYVRPFVALHLALVILGALLLLASLRALARKPLVWLCVLVAAFQIVLVVKSGGDWMPMWRFALPVLPFAFALMAAGSELSFRRLDAWEPRVPHPGLLAVFLITPLVAAGISLLLVRQSLQLRVAQMNVVWTSALDTAQELREIIPPGERIASCAMGVVPYVLLDNPFVDMVGLCDAHIAHQGRRALPQLGLPDRNWEKADPDYVFELRQPEWVLIVRAPAENPVGSGPGSEERVRGSDGREWTVSGTSATNQLAARHRLLRADYELAAEVQNQPLPVDPEFGGASRRVFVYRRKQQT